MKSIRTLKWLVPFAAVTGTMLVCDAWFDVLTSRGTMDVTVSAVLAVVAELPLAVFCFWIARSVERVLEDARPYLTAQGFRIEHRRLVPPGGTRGTIEK